MRLYNLHCENVKAEKNDYSWFLTIDTYVGSEKILIGGIYLSATTNKNTVLNHFEQWCGRICEGRAVVLIGDFNVNMSVDTPFRHKINNICDDNGLVQIVSAPTRITQTSSTLIDLCLVNFNKINKVNSLYSERR